MTETKITSSVRQFNGKIPVAKEVIDLLNPLYFHFQVIVKFIRKAKILVDCWIDDPVLGSIPLEIALLAKLKHPNIVKVNIIFTFLFHSNDNNLVRGH